MDSPFAKRERYVFAEKLRKVVLAPMNEKMRMTLDLWDLLVPGNRQRKIRKLEK